MENLNLLANAEALGTQLRSKVDSLFPGIDNVTLLLKKTVKLLGGEFVGTDDPDYPAKIGGSLFIESLEKFYIKLPFYSSPLSDNFTVAHELGHYFMHYTKGQAVFHRYGNNAQEVQANRFAAAFLMPKDKLLAAKKQFNGSITLIAAHFQVPTDVVNQRLEYIENV